MKPMTQEEQTAAFEAELKMLIYRYGAEFGLTLASIIGVLEVAKLNIYHQKADEDNDNDDDDD